MNLTIGAPVDLEIRTSTDGPPKATFMTTVVDLWGLKSLSLAGRGTLFWPTLHPEGLQCVVGTSRNHSEANLWRLKRLSIDNDIDKISLSLHDTVAIRKTLLRLISLTRFTTFPVPAVSRASFREPMVSMDQIFQPVVSFLEILKDTESSAHFFNAASTDCFGNQPGVVLDENSALQPY